MNIVSLCAAFMINFLFLLSKLAWALLRPASLLLLALTAGVALPWHGYWLSGRLIVGVVVVILVVISVFPIGTWMLRPLEERFPPLPSEPKHVDGIIVLGGAVNPKMTADRGKPALYENAERMFAFVTLARRHPEARLLFTGGSGSLMPGSLTEADVARMLFTELGLEISRIVFERESRNTWENAAFSKKAVQPQPGETWLLITSAMLMPRSVGSFRKVGWPVVPWPVAYKTGHDEATGIEVDLAGNLCTVNAAAHEFIGLSAYWLMGRTDAWFPAPCYNLAPAANRARMS